MLLTLPSMTADMAKIKTDRKVLERTNHVSNQPLSPGFKKHFDSAGMNPSVGRHKA
jgi:hypothetical protein